MRLGVGAVVMLATAALIGGCQTVVGRLPQGPAQTQEPLVWPRPPAAPHIRFVRIVAYPEDLGIRPAWWRRVGEFLFGKEQQRFVRPTGVAARGAALYVADPGAQVLWVLDPDAGRVRRLATAGDRRLICPVAVALGPSGRLYLADSYLGDVFAYDAAGRCAATIAHPQMRRPAGLAYDARRDRLYVADSGAHCVWIFAGDGAPLGRIGRRGSGDGAFNFPTHVAVDRDGMVYVTDSLGFQVQRFNPDGTFAGRFGRHGDMSGDFAMPKGVAVDSRGHIYVVDALFDAVQLFDREGRFLLSFGERGVQPGQLWLPGGLFIDPQDRIYVADAYNRRIHIFECLPNRDAS